MTHLKKLTQLSQDVGLYDEQSFIKKQQELADALHRNRTDRPSRKEIHQLVEKIITNTGEELMRLANEDKLEAELHYDMRGMERTQGFAEGINIMKKHIMSVTGVE